MRGVEAGVRGVRGGQARFGGLARHGIDVVAPANVAVAVVVRADPLVANGGLDPLGGLKAIVVIVVKERDDMTMAEATV